MGAPLESPAKKRTLAHSGSSEVDIPDFFPLTQTDWVLVFNTGGLSIPKPNAPAEKSPKTEEIKGSVKRAWTDVIQRLMSVGLQFRVLPWDAKRVGVFVYCPEKILMREVYRSRVIDWINDSGISELEPPVLADPSPDTFKNNPLPTPAERLRLVHELLTSPTYDGGAGLTMDQTVVDTTEAVGGNLLEAVFCVHDREFADKWVKSWSQRWLLREQDLDAIRDYAGEKVAFYFAFLRFYLTCVAPLAAMGLSAWLMNASFSPIYAVFVIVWGIVTINVWNRKASVYASRWGTRNYSKIEKIRPEFRPTKIEIDPVTEERIPVYPYWRRWLVRAGITLPITLALIGFLLVIVLTIVSSEVFFHKYYNGPWKEYLHYTPTIIYSAAIPVFHSYYVSLAQKLSRMENPLTDTTYASSFAQKLFTFNSLVGFMGLFADAFVVVPLSSYIGSYLKTHDYQIADFQDAFSPAMLQGRLTYLMITGQVLNAATELIVPLLTTKATTTMHGLHKSKDEKKKETDEETYIRHVKNEFERPPYDIDADYSEMIIQFGYLTLFSSAWPIAAVLCLINNFLELRADAFKICKANRRPIPQRADNIGPWINNLRLFSWLSALTTPAIVVLYRNWDMTQAATTQLQARLPTLLATLLVSEHLYLLVRHIVQEATRAVPTRGLERRRRAEFELKKRYLMKAGIDVLAGRHGGAIRWNGEGSQGNGSIMFGVALNEIHAFLEGKKTASVAA
ncbi:calcium-activated chloride channel-domain-containing protein [Phlyctochytrium arcticum]|nr:calcium-activated chloride channel-domain-containing protein [Phlyctochytrium arcticum]